MAPWLRLMENVRMPAVKRGFGEVIAKRTLHVGDGGTGTVVVSLGRPRPSGFDLEWECPFRIKGPALETVEFGRGIDAMQALVTALDGIRYVLDQTGLTLSWKDGIPDHTGFQRGIPVSLGATFAKRLERLVDREIARRVRSLEARHNRRAAKRKN
jgi:hypothetical protein